jgi:beta-lactamase class A
MADNLSRRSAIGLGAAAAAAATFGLGGPAAAAGAAPAAQRGSGATRIAKTYRKQKAAAGGVWATHVAMVDAAGELRSVVEDNVDHVTNGYSVQKLAVATAVLDKVDRGELALDHKLELLGGKFLLEGSGIYHLQAAVGDQLTVAGFLTAMLLVSDNTAVRLCGLVAPALEINEILAAKGFTHTRVEPVATNPNRFFLGFTTPRETHDLLWRLANRTLLAPASCDFMLKVMTGESGYHDGVRRVMSSAERGRVATKYGASDNDLGESRHEVGIMFSASGAPALTYAMFADGLGDPGNYGSTHPAVQAHAVLGRTMFDALPAPTVAAKEAGPRQRIRPYRPLVGL